MTGIFYGSSMGTTESLAKDIAAALDIPASDIYDVAKASAEDLNKYDVLLLGSSTWGYGELQDDWVSFIDTLKSADLTGKKTGLFGSGDSQAYEDTFCDALGIIHEELEGSGVQFIGLMDADGYAAQDSKAFADGKVLGLAIDDNNEADMTESRLNKWIELIKNNI